MPLIFLYWQPCAFNMVVSKQHKMIFFIFSQVNKEERLFVVVQDLQALLKKVKLWVQGKRTTLKFFKQLDGRPWTNYLQATLILESCIKRKNIKDLKVPKCQKEGNEILTQIGYLTYLASNFCNYENIYIAIFLICFIIWRPFIEN